MNKTYTAIEDFRPPWFLRSGHIQTLLTGFYRPKPSLPTPKEYKLSLGENGFGLVFENSPTGVASQRDDEAVLLLHGLGSSHSGTYMTSMAKLLIESGMRVFRADLPGAGNSGRFTPLPPHGACYREVWTMLQELVIQTGIPRWRIAGVSLGANILLKMLARRDELRLDSSAMSIVQAIAIAPPINLAECCINIERGINRMYSDYFVRALRKQALARAKIWPQWAKQMDQASFKSIRKFDETVTAPLAGFRDAAEYYFAGSSADELSQIDVPTTILIDEHDPIVPATIFDTPKFSGSITLQKTRFGGHVGYMHQATGYRAKNSEQKSRRTLVRWLDEWVVQKLLNEPNDS